MSDYKIRVANEAESKEVQGFLKSNGYERKIGNFKLIDGWVCINEKMMILCVSVSQAGDELNEYKELTLIQLKDLVVLKRNDRSDKTHTREQFDWFVSSCGQAYVYDTSHWILMGNSTDIELQPIEPKMSILDTGRLEMKEYLRKDLDGHYILELTTEDEAQEFHAKHWIEVPKGCDYLISNLGVNSFIDGDLFSKVKPKKVLWSREKMKEYLDKQEDGTYKLIKIDSRSVGDDSIEVSKGANFAYKENGELGIHIINSELELVWQRHTQPEALPLIDDLPITEDFIFNPSISERYAEIEKVRQKTVQDTLAERQKEYGSFEDVAFVTQGLVDFLSRHTKYDEMPKTHKEALHMIASKVARLTMGNHNSIDGWHDIAGYAKLIENLLSDD